MKNIYTCILLFALFNVHAQDRNLLFVGDETITVEDFMRTYDKNRLDNDTLEFSESIDEYLRLYINFKLKVKEAESLGLDTLQSFVRELNGYRRQLVKPYLTDTEVSDQLLIEAYDRLKSEVSASHILIQAEGSDTLLAYNKILDIRERIVNGADFADLALKYSEDPSVSENNGYLGYFSAFYMVYPFETAAYTTPIESVSEPVRTRFGYHILKIHDKRPSRGEVKVAHIMIKSNIKDSLSVLKAKAKIDEIHDSLVFRNGDNFADLAQQFSDDKKSGSKGGELEWFGINKMVESFEDVAFSLESVGDFSLPCETPFGWHIIKLIDKKKISQFDTMKESIKKKLERDSRSQKTRDVVINRLKKEWGFTENANSNVIFHELINQDFFDGKSIVEKIKGQGVIMFMFNNNYDLSTRYVYQKDFAEYLTTYRSRLPKNLEIELLVTQFYKTFQEQKILDVESVNLENKYNDFRLLIDEYHDGILLFNLSEQKIWNKAIQDTLGLQNFYEKNQNQYTWSDRIAASIYSCKDVRTKNRVYNNLSWDISDKDILEKMNRNSNLNLSIETGLYEFGDNPTLDQFVFSLQWDQLEGGQIIKCADTNQIIVVDEILKSSIKPMGEIKGLVISDYQSFLEDIWLKELRNKYSVSINQDLLHEAKNKKIDYTTKDNDFNTPNCKTFSSCFSQAAKNLGYSKDVYFGWSNQIYNTSVKP
tara:strand:- start:15364 stop:17484 length:2121 start_codon:yes stop_codon:yes gene_type:complete